MEEDLLEKSAEMFLSYGFKTVTMDDIAMELGISKKTIYKYFPNKEALVDACTRKVQQKMDSIINEITQKGYNAIEENFAIKKVFKEMFKKAKTSPMHQLKKYYPKTFKKMMNNEFCSFNECMTANLKKGIEEGLYRGKIDIDMMMKFYFIIVFGVYESELFGTNMGELLKVELKVLEYHTRAIATEDGLKILEKQLYNYLS